MFSRDAKALLHAWGNSWIETTDLKISPGPYFYTNNALWEVMRLYDDYQGTFLVSIRPSAAEETTYEILNDGKHGWYVQSSLACRS